MPDLATLTIAGPITTLTFNRPDAHNALSIAMLTDAHRCMDEVESLARSDSAPTVLVVTGAGRSFCAGMDLKEVIIEDDPTLPVQLLESLARLTHRIRLLPMVVVGRVNGAAIGGGCGLVTVCDLAITHADAKLGFPEVDLGLCPAVVAPWLVRKIGPGKARQVLLSGGLMSGATAFEFGIVSSTVETRDELDGAVRKLTNTLATGGREALGATKKLLNTLDGSNDLDILLEAAKLSASVLATEDAQNRLKARRK
ncbi:MAG: enoyl-CoA hydratase/isomerase family protein [Phycisphaerales bacterium]|nr:enoyl-CoA hydratase/isomerase family protein [Phycisphaerales bacterium]MCB9836633.1 enoyl-CoA hydratase/isomerase family protein [Phycisphaera sp.]